MKKILFLLALLPALLCACSSNGEEPKEEKFQFIQLKLNSDNEDINPHVSLFYGWVGTLSEPFVVVQSIGKYMTAAHDSSGEDYVFPITGQYAEKMKFYNSVATKSFYIDDLALSNIYGTPTTGGKFVVCLYLDGEAYSKEFNITKNSLIEAKYNDADKSVQWNISDYK